MAMRKCLTAAAVFLLSISGAGACDDYPEEMALAAAQRDAERARSATAQQDPATQVASATLGQPAAGTTEVESAPGQATANLAGALRP